MSRKISIRPVIMSGGAGTRLWPLSRQARPKQFLPLTSDRSLFQEAVLRVSGDGFSAPVVIGALRHADLAALQCASVGAQAAAIIAEPSARNTAAVAAIAALWTQRAEPGSLALLLPADQHVGDPQGFRDAVMRGAAAAAKGKIVTFGVKPTEPHTGFGYIECGAEIAPGVFDVAAFREKPDPATAAAYLAGGRHHWNAGVFLFSPQAMLDELTRHAPQIMKSAREAFEQARDDAGIMHLDDAAFASCPSQSIDYAVMEKTSAAAVAGPLDIGWSDIGAWSAAIEGAPEDGVSLIDSEGALVKSDGAFVGVVGLPGIVVVATRDAVLVVHKSRAQDVKKIVEDLAARGRSDLL